MDSRLTNFIWHIDGSYVPQIQARLKDKSLAPFQAKLPAAYEAKIQANGVAKSWNMWLTDRFSTDRSVLVLPLSGEMSRYSWDNFGNDFYIRALKSAASDADFKGAVLQMNTPGGTADSTPAFAQAVADFRKSKPIIVQTAYCASAGIYVASQANEIHIENQAASSVGSIGTLLIRENYAEYLKMAGIEIEIMRATKSKDKALVNWIEPTPEEALALLQTMLDECQREFEGAVKRGRAGKITSEEVFTGKMYGADLAIKLGLADRKGDLPQAVKRVLELAA
ncbi:S49 family peptidase [Dyadobacter sp. CY323]|uniref:S49 family peptidase n=1 Tax=Dyadobacter sp. CY323 TaxID=2907302 RepID=UPI001F2F87B2|nr:S49 family peptidase [Dyadobacter sp. CY323]MCE6987488.1 S49 family peptidase [Dyadobacter sp. CY323]